MRGNHFLVALVVLAGMSVSGWGQAPLLLNYQGRLTSPSGAAVVDGSYNLQFKLYRGPSTSSSIWSETQNNVSVRSGVFGVLLGASIPLPATAFSDPGALYLGVKVGSDTEMSPRQQIASVAFAQRAGDADMAGGYVVSATPQANSLVPLNASAVFPANTVGTTSLADSAVTAPKADLILRNFLQNGDFERWDAGTCPACPTAYNSNGCGMYCRETGAGNYITGSSGVRIPPGTYWADLNQNLSNWNELKGQWITLGVWCKANTPADFCFYVYDGMTADQPCFTATTTWQFFQYSRYLPANASALGVQVFRQYSPTTTYYVDGGILVKGTHIPMLIQHWQ